MAMNLFIVFAVSVLLFAYTVYKPFSSTKEIGKAPIIETKSGKLFGSIATSRSGKEYFEYLGIPYALPPIGEKRFEPPEPITPWNGIKEATSYGSKCLQLDFLTSKLGGSEDCLFLNVFAPRKKTKAVLLPVMVFIHGGAFFSGSSDMYGATYFMDQEVVFVTLNYRLAGLGFLNTGDDVVRGNMGLKDQLMALKWINTNIKSFGADPNRVTLFGESAGAASVHYHILSPRSKGLFSKAISQSGSPLSHWANYKKPKEQAQRFAAKFGCPIQNSKEMIACLKKVDGAQLVNEHREMTLPLRDPITVFVPTIESYNDENTFLSEDPYVLLKEGRFNKIPMLAGVNSEEGLLTSGALTANQTRMDEANEKWSWWVSKILNIPEDEKNARLIRKFYFGDETNIASKSFLSNYTNLFSDRLFFVPVHRHAKLYSKHASIRMYYYTHKGDFCLGNIMAATQGRFHFLVNVVIDIISSWFRRTVMNENIPHMGTAHADEIPFLFDFAVGYTIQPGHKDFELSKNMVKLWVSFATNEDSQPVTYDKLIWLPVNSKDSTLTYLQLDTHPNLVDEPFADRVEFWENLAIPH